MLCLMVICLSRKEAGRRKVAFAEELHTSAPAGSQSIVRRGRKPRATPSAKAAALDAQKKSDQHLQSRYLLRGVLSTAKSRRL